MKKACNELLLEEEISKRSNDQLWEDRMIKKILSSGRIRIKTLQYDHLGSIMMKTAAGFMIAVLSVLLLSMAVKKVNEDVSVHSEMIVSQLTYDEIESVLNR